jgi:hypothetical protein
LRVVWVREMGHMEERGDGNGQLFLYRGVGERMGWRGCPISTTTRWKGGGLFGDRDPSAVAMGGMAMTWRWQVQQRMCE